jgi:hypothetical protein
MDATPPTARAPVPLLTPGRIARRLGVPLTQVLHILATRPEIRHVARAGTLRVYDEAALEAVRRELEAMDAPRLSLAKPQAP